MKHTITPNTSDYKSRYRYMNWRENVKKTEYGIILYLKTGTWGHIHNNELGGERFYVRDAKLKFKHTNHYYRVGL